MDTKPGLSSEYLNVYENMNGQHSSGLYERLDDKNENQYYNVPNSTVDHGVERVTTKKKFKTFVL